jgi:hypothetical protein
MGQKMEVVMMEFKHWHGLLCVHGIIDDTHISIQNSSLHLQRIDIIIKVEAIQLWHM